MSSPLQSFAHVDPVEDVAVLENTDKTTGTSNGAMLTHFNLLSAAAIGGMALPLTESDVSLTVLPLFHIFGMTAAMNAPLYAGGRIILLPSFDVKEVMSTIQKEKVTAFCGVPTMYIAVNNHPDAAKFDLKTVKVAFSGGAALPIAVAKKFKESTGGSIVEGYGLSESSAVGCTNPFKEAKFKVGSIGMPFPSTDARIVSLDDPMLVLGVGEVGELELRGPQMMKGYWNNEKETNLVLRDGWLLTGDIARMDEDGYFFIVDRKKDLISVGGMKVYPREVEEVLFEHPLVKEAAVVSYPHPYMGETVKAFIVLKDPATKEKAQAEITAFCIDRLAKFKVPHEYEFVDELPKTLVGKVLRRKLREQSVKPQ